MEHIGGEPTRTVMVDSKVEGEVMEFLVSHGIKFVWPNHSVFTAMGCGFPEPNEEKQEVV